jgi:hypothetical protein
VLNNTVLLSGTYRAAIEYRYPGASGLLIANNLIDATIWAREGATATLASNVLNASPDMFVNVSAGDLHLTSSAQAAIDQGIAVPDLVNDWDGDSRPMGAAFDIGADEYVAPVVTYGISGRVTSLATGAALANTVVSLSGTQSTVVTTDGNGFYAFQGLSASGEFIVTPQRAGYIFSPATRSYSGLTGGVFSADFSARAVIVANQPPTITLSVSKASIPVGERITLNAVATDVDNAVSGVAFYVDQKLLGTDTTNPYTLSWKPAKAGTYTVIATATDSAGSTATSKAIVVSVTAKSHR